MWENQSKKGWNSGKNFTVLYVLLKSHFKTTTRKFLKSEYYTCMNAHIHNKTISSSSSWFFLVPYHHKTILLLPTLWRHQYQLFCLIEQLTVSYIIISLLLRAGSYDVHVLLEEGEDRVSPTGVPIAKKEGMYCQFFVSFLLHQDFLEFTLDRKRDTKGRPFLRMWCFLLNLAHN